MVVAIPLFKVEEVSFCVSFLKNSLSLYKYKTLVEKYSQFKLEIKHEEIFLNYTQWSIEITTTISSISYYNSSPIELNQSSTKNRAGGNFCDTIMTETHKIKEHDTINYHRRKKKELQKLVIQEMKIINNETCLNNDRKINIKNANLNGGEKGGEKHPDEEREKGGFYFIEREDWREREDANFFLKIVPHPTNIPFFLTEFASLFTILPAEKDGSPCNFLRVF